MLEGLVDVRFGGLVSREDDNRVLLEAALYADDLILDHDAIEGRPGYSNPLGTGVAVVGSGTGQLLARFRPAPTSARTVPVIGGTVYVVTDPASDMAQDSIATAVSSPAGPHFGSSDKISAAQLGTNLYIGSDSATQPMKRLTSGFALNSLETIAQAQTLVLAAFSPLAFTLFKDLTPTDSGAGITLQSGTSGLGTNWRAVMDGAGTGDPAAGEWIYFELENSGGAPTSFDARAYDWLVVAITPYDGNSPNNAVTIQAATISGGSPGTFEDLGQTYDVPPVGGSPNIVFLSLLGLSSSVRSALRYLKFYLSGTSGGRFGVYGYCFLPSPQKTVPTKYYVTAQNAATLQESPISAALDVEIKTTDKLDQSGPGLKYPDCYLDGHSFRNSGSIADIMNPGNRRVFNAEANKAKPSLADIGALVSITVTLPATWTAGLVVRLWKDTSEGRRLVTSYTLLSGDISAGSLVLTDNGGLSTLFSTKFKAGGTPPRTNAMAAMHGRLICGYGNRVSISSFTPTDQTSNAYPQFPDIALEDADGWSFDLPSQAEQIQTLHRGDALYIGTNEAVYVMGDLSPNSPNYQVAGRGVVSRRGAAYLWGIPFNGRLVDAYFWCATDGVYFSVNRSGALELSESVARLYATWFLPDATTVLGYQDRVLYAVTGTRCLRFDFQTGYWTRWTLSNTMQHSAFWTDPGAATQQLWLLTSDRKIERLQATAVTDDGSAIPDWRYSTGFDRPGAQSAVRGFVGDVTGDVRLKIAATIAESPSMDYDLLSGITAGSTQANADEVWSPGSSSFKSYKWRLEMRGANRVKVRQLLWERVGLSVK